ncbi:hypothetical protein [Paenibacillus sp. FSL R7-0337]|uniref:hypothetical protein n=1 Tax=Paenibacillus sp. FSL R7-0337 TaxID=1926588 RepID=UPI00096FF2F5|nr:hypothetical protein [Paenibacillus sp. FSL R7-0337]OMF88535.1 hypothetical protein BK147_26900 [Paenibacillus sp. FSL R7-0337]
MPETQLRIIFQNKYLEFGNVLDWIKRAPRFIPVKFKSVVVTKGEALNYNEKDFSGCFTKEIRKKAPVFITVLDSNGNQIMINKGRDAASLIIGLNTSSGMKLEEWVAYADTFFEENIGIVACIYPEDDYFWQQNVDLGQYEKYGKSTDELKLKKMDSVTVAIDPTSLPGRSSYVKDIWFGSTWMMWFGPDYFQFIPYERLLEFDQAFNIRTLSNKTVVIQLYGNSKEVQSKESRQKQWAFRNYFEINELTSILHQEEAITKRLNSDPSIKYTKEI